jgi:predicted dehydrogenase
VNDRKQDGKIDVNQALRAGVVGAGFIGRVHARAVRTLGHVVAGVAASSPQRSREAAGDLGALRAYDTADELVESDDIDVVHVCTPNHLHAPVVRKALLAGKHVVVEKPVAVSAEQAGELVRLWQDTDRVVAVPFVYRFYPTVREARDRLRGEGVRLIHGSYLQDWMSRAGDTDWRVSSALGGPSRTFGDIGVHWCDLAEFVSGHRIARVSAVLPRVLHRRGSGAEVADVDTEDAALVTFETEQGAYGSTVISQISPGRKNRLRLNVDTADTEFAFNQEEPDTLWLGGREETRVLHRGEAGLGADASARSLVPPGHPQGYLGSFTGFVADAYASIRGDKPEGLPTLADGLRAAAITEAVLKSAQQRNWVEVGS